MTVRVADPTVVTQVARAHTLAAVIAGLPLPPHLHERFTQNSLVRSVDGALTLGGTDLSETEITRLLGTRSVSVSAPVTPSSRAEQEALRLADVHAQIATLLRDGMDASVTEERIRDFHGLVTGWTAAGSAPGTYRSITMRAGDYLPPPPEDVPRLMEQFVRWLTDGPPAQWDPVVRAIVAHFYLDSINPFAEGNRYVALAVESYLLRQAGIPARGLVSLAHAWARRRVEYAAMLDYVRFQSYPDLTPFVVFGLEALAGELEAVFAAVQDAYAPVAYREFARESLAQAGKLDARGGDRLLSLVFGLDRPVPLRALRAGKHPLSALYRDLAAKTLARDLAYLREQGLVIIENDVMRANLAAVTAEA